MGGRDDQRVDVGASQKDTAFFRTRLQFVQQEVLRLDIAMPTPPLLIAWVKLACVSTWRKHSDSAMATAWLASQIKYWGALPTVVWQLSPEPPHVAIGPGEDQVISAPTILLLHFESGK